MVLGWRLSNLGLNPPESLTPCWRLVATAYPPGNRDSLRLETCLSYLTRLGTVSHRSSPLSPWFALLTARERRQRNWWILPSASAFCDADLEGSSQPAWLNLSPVTWDYLWNVRCHSFVCHRPSRFFQWTGVMLTNFARLTMISYAQLIDWSALLNILRKRNFDQWNQTLSHGSKSVFTNGSWEKWRAVNKFFAFPSVESIRTKQDNSSDL